MPRSSHRIRLSLACTAALLASAIGLYGGQTNGQTAGQPSGQTAGPISGPLAPHATERSGDLVVEQLAAGHTLITLHSSTIEILADIRRGERYEFHVERRRTSDQRLVRIASTHGVTITQKLDDSAPVQLICHQRRTADPNALDTAPRPPLGQHIPGAASARNVPVQPPLPTDNELTTSVHHGHNNRLAGVTVEIDGKGIQIDAHRRTTGSPGALFAYDLAPGWSGPGGTERAIHIIATPGVRVEEFARASGPPPASYGRRPVADVIYVQNPQLVPGHGQRVSPSAFLPIQAYIGTNPRDDRSSLLVTTGRAGVTIREVLTGSAIRIHSDDPPGGPWRGARFAYHIVAPAQRRDGGQTTQIRVLAGPGTKVEWYESRIRPSLGADEVDSLGDMNVELVLYRTNDVARIPAQGAPLSPALLRAVGTRSRPDVRHWAAPTAGQTVALMIADTSLSAVPGVGDAADIAELGRAAFTGKDRHNRPVSTFEMGVMGIAAILPFVGPSALRTVSRGARSATAIAARFGRTVDEMEALLCRATMLTPQDRAAIGRIERAMRTGGRAASADLRHVRQSLEQLGFVIDLAPAHGDIFLFPEVTHTLGRIGAQGESAEAVAIRAVGRQAAGVVRRPRHHLLPREHRTWFEERGFVGEHDIDNYTVELEQAKHQAIHGGGNWRLGGTWPGNWNRRVMQDLRAQEEQFGRKLTRQEVFVIVKELRSVFDVQGPFVRYNAP